MTRSGALARALATPAATQQTRARRVLDSLDIDLDLDGRGGGRTPLRAQGEVGTLVVANHTSWLDIVVLLALEPVTFLAKREVGGWPVLGRAASRAGTLFVDRWALRTLPSTVAAIADRLRAGHSVAVFPEATTWCSAPGGPFRRAVFQAALDAGAPVRPVTIGYRQRETPSTVAAFVGDDTLARSLHRVLRARELTASVDVAPVLDPHGDRRTLAKLASAAVLAGADDRTTAEPSHV